ncbi:putative ribonuclease H-like domain-containing protein [Tanacetum coccineum]
MESQSETTQTVSALKLPVLKTGDYDLWSMRMKQYLTHTDYGLWEVIVNGDAPAIASANAYTKGPIPPKIAKQKLARKKRIKSKKHYDAKTLWEAIKARFGGNKESKKMQKTILKKQYENFAASRSEGVYKTYDRFQKLISQLKIHDTLSMDDLYNNPKVYESEIKGQSSSNSQNVAFVSSENTSSINEAVNTAYEVSTASSQGQASSSTYVDDVMFSFFANQSNTCGYAYHEGEKILKEDRKESEFQWAPRNQGNRNGDAPRRIVPVETPANALVVQDGIGYQMGLESLEARIVVHEKNEAVYEEDIAFLKYDVQVKDISIKDLKNQLEEALKEKDDLKLKLEKFEESSKNLTKLINSQISAKDKAGLGYDSQMNESEVVHSVFNSRESDVDDSLVNDRFKTGEGFHAVPPPYTGNYMPSRPDLSFAGLDDSVYKTKVSETETSISKTSKDIVEKPKTVRPSAPIIEDWDTDSDNDSVFRPKSDQTKPKFTKINFVKSDENVKSVNKENTHRQVEYPRKSQSPRDNRRNWNGMMTQKLGNGFEFIKKACFVCGSFNHLIKDSDFHDKKMVEKSMLNNKGRVTGQREIRPSGQVPINTAKQSSPRAVASISTAKPVNTTAPKSKVNDALPKTYSYFKAHSPGNPQYTLQDQGIFDSGCSRHMTGNKSFLIDYQEINGGFVAFGESPKGSKIIRKGKIRTGKLDFEDVYFVKELKFNLFSVSQMCDKKNSVLFTETECLVLSPDFKLLDESQVLLKVPRQNNMYSFDLKNVVPSGGLTCLFAKATIDESNLWHRRLGHINFKTMNKLVRGNLKGKQHKASCKTKLVSSISQPLQMLHMDLFGPTSVRSINHKTYCLVVTDDYSRFSWVFFLATKDETSGILKTFITSIENQINHKVKIIRCDNGTEFKNNDLNQFCGMKGIKREFSVARTPQQNGVVERKNRTLIEAARTMLADSLLPTTFWAEAVSIACYVQNKVLVTKPHNKTPYKLLHGRPPSISFMRPFGCPVTILNTLDSLGKFDGKADEGFFVGYSINSKAFRVFNTRTRKAEENLHITFLENKPNVAESGPDWLFDIDLLRNSMNYEPVTAGNQTNKNAVADDAGKKTNKEPVNEGERNGQEKDRGASNKEDDQNVQDFRVTLDNLIVQQKKGYANNTNRDSTVSPFVSTARQSFTNANDLPTDPLMLDLEDTADLLNIGIFSGAYDDEDVGAEADLNNLETTMNVSPIPTTRIHKDHPKDQIIRDINSATQTRRMTKISEELAMVSYIKKQRRTNHKDYQNCLVACFLSQIEPKKVTQALTDPSWIEAMQDELLYKIKLVINLDLIQWNS